MDYIKEKPGLSVLIAFIVGLIIGQTLFGWYLFPVEWTGAGPADLEQAERDVYLQTIADAYSYQPGNTGLVNNALRSWPNSGEAICELRSRTADPAAQQRLDAIAMVQTGGQACGAVSADGTLPEVPAPPEDDSNLGTILVLLLVLAIVTAWWIIRTLSRRRRLVMRSVAAPNCEIAHATSARTAWSIVPPSAGTPGRSNAGAGASSSSSPAAGSGE